MNSIKGNINKVKGSVEKVMCALNNLLARQDDERKVSLKESIHAKTIGTHVENNPY